METADLASANQSNNSTSPPQYNDAKLVLLGVAMAILVLVIVFGKLRNNSSAVYQLN